ncbi:MAG: hypothetical protein J1E63_08400, partial [Muribaculaceae bacterium]|nr:hypothetical protein [Muribaculaceae bacterium]
MKKLLLLSAVAGLCATSVYALEPKIYPGEAFMGVSANSQYAVSAAYGRVGIFDLVSGQNFEYLPDDETFTTMYGLVPGNKVSNNGVVVGTTDNINAAYWKDGEWNVIKSTIGRNLAQLYGISNDGKTIVGAVSPISYGGDYNGLMLYPCYWEVQEDGTYGDIIDLPYPTEDLTGRTPQYITAFAVSDDGNTILGQVQDFAGSIIEPIMYTKDANGEWSYTMIHSELFHPEGLTLPDCPEDMDYPQAESFMTPEEIAAFEDALNDWYLSGDDNWDNYPQISDYMTDEEKAALAAAEDEYEVWYEQFMKFQEAYMELVARVPTFEFNNLVMTPDAGCFATTAIKNYFDPMTWESWSEYSVYKFNLNDGTFKAYPTSGPDILVSSISAAGDVLGCSRANNQPYCAYILPADGEQFETLENYIASSNASLADWIKENMTHSYESFDWLTGEIVVVENQVMTGIPFTNSDLSLIVTYCENLWDYEDLTDVYGYMFGLESSGIQAVKVGTAGAKSLGKGVLGFTGDVAAAQVYDM